MWLMLQQESPNDFVVATGKSYTLKDFIELVFKWFNLEWKDYVIQSDEFQRPSDIAVSKANPEKINNDLGWQAKTFLPEIVDKMINETYW
jgi:GDPmannose 4,6-dehydratase